MAANDVFGWLGTCFCIFFFASPAVPYFKVIRGKLNFEDSPIIVVFASYCNCFLWAIYGKMAERTQVKICNIIGAGFSLLYICIYLFYEIRKYIIDTILNVIIIISGSFATYRGLFILVDDKDVVGKMCILASMIVFLSPIQLIYRVCKENNYILIPIYSAYVNICNTLSWIMFGILVKDVYVILPNLVGLALAIIQIAVFKYYKKTYPLRDIAGSTIGIEASSEKEEGKMNVEDKKDDIKEMENIKEIPVKIAQIKV